MDKWINVNDPNSVSPASYEISIKGIDGYETYITGENEVSIRPKWINVNDKLPDDQQPIIFYVKDRDQCFCGYLDYDPKHPKFRENIDDWWFDDEEITHWMPLPEPQGVL